MLEEAITVVSLAIEKEVMPEEGVEGRLPPEQGPVPAQKQAPKLQVIFCAVPKFKAVGPSEEEGARHGQPRPPVYSRQNGRVPLCRWIQKSQPLPTKN